jgi:pimeloyl-ACP methyl ester carboxylesterase
MLLRISWLPYAEGSVLPGTTHFMLLQDPRGVAEVLAAFWERHRLPAGGA